MKKRIFQFVILMVVLISMGILGCGGGGSSVSGDESLASTPKSILTANSDDNTVTFVNAETLVVEATIDVSLEFPWEITVSDDNTRAYVSCRGARDGVDKGGISIIDLESHEEIGTITGLTGTDPSETELVGDTLYVAFIDNMDADANDMISVVDLSVNPPVETSVVDLVGFNEQLLSLEVTADGTKLYAAGEGYSLHVIDLTVTPPVLSTIVPTSNYHLRQKMVGDQLYLSGYGYDIEILDTTTDTILADTVPLGTNSYTMGMEKVGNTVWSANGRGGLAKTDLTRNMDNFDWYYEDDDYMTITLPFSFNFLGTDYTEAYMGTSGVVTFDESVADAYDYDAGYFLGFSPLPEDLNSAAGLFNISYNVSADGQRAVFQWSTATYDDETDPMAVTVFELVLYADGRARFDYRGSGANAINEDDDNVYGVGDGANTDILDLRAITGVSAFDLEKRSFLWDPASPSTVSEVAFNWEGTGVTWLPVPGTPHGIEAAGNTLYVPFPKDNMMAGNTTNSLLVFDTVTEAEVLVTVGNGPRAVALVY